MSPFHRDKFVLIGIKTIAGFSVLSLMFIIFFLIYESAMVLNTTTVSQYLFDQGWYPAEGQFLLLPMIIGSVLIALGAMLISIPTGILTAILLHFYAPRFFAGLLQRIIELLGGIPSVVFGFWGIVVIVPLLSAMQAPGTSLLAGIIVLSIIVVPGMTLFACTALQQIDQMHIQNAIALGLTRFSIIRHIIIPQARQGLLTGMILQSGRAVGETLAVLMVCGNVVQIPGSIFDPVRTLTSNIALEMAYATDTHRSALFLSGLLLMMVVLVLVLVAEKIKPSQG